MPPLVYDTQLSTTPALPPLQSYGLHSTTAPSLSSPDAGPDLYMYCSSIAPSAANA